MKVFKVKKDVKNNGSKFKCKMGVMREYFRIPNNVSIVATINGTIHEDDLIRVLKEITTMHPLTGVRIVVDSNHDAWFTDEGAEPLLLKVTPRKSSRQWIDIIENESNIPFNFENGPLIRFILVKSKEVSDLIVICQHSICDGISLTNIVQDIVFLLNNPKTCIERIDPVLPVPENFPTVPLRFKLKLLKNRLIMDRINQKWNKQRTIFDEVDYQDVHKAYTQKYSYKIIAEELSQSQTLDLINWCRQNDVTVNSAVSAALLAGRHGIRGEFTGNNHVIQIAVNIRDYLKKPAERVFGFLAGGIKFESEYIPEKTFLDNVNLFHKKVLLELDENKILEPIIGHYISPTLTDGINFATYSRWVPDNFSRYQKLSPFLQNETNKAVVISNQIIDNMPGLMISNLGNIKAQNEHGSIKLDQMYFVTSSSPFLDLVVGVVTVNRKLTLTLNYMEDNHSDKSDIELKKIMQKSIEYLTTAIKTDHTENSTSKSSIKLKNDA
jgi:Uncharacterized protein containing a NRPS condensation (elongation) domain